MLQIIEHGDEVAQAAAKPSSFHTVSVSPSCRAFKQRVNAGRLVSGGSRNAFILKKRLAPGTLQGGQLHGRVLVIGRDAGNNRISCLNYGTTKRDTASPDFIDRSFRPET